MCPRKPHTTGDPISQEALQRRGRGLLLVEAGFARCVGATMAGPFMTALVLAFGGQERRLGLATAAAHIGAAGMLLTNPVLNRIGSRRTFCLVSLGAVRTLRIVIAALPLLIYAGVGAERLYWPFAGCVLVSALFGMSAEISRRSWISDLVPAGGRGRFFGWRVTIAMLVHAGVLLAGGRLLDISKARTGQHLPALMGLLGFGALMGWIGWTLLYRAPEPPMSLPRRRSGPIRSLVLPWRSPRFRPLLILAAASALATGICGGFFDFYMLRHVGMRFGWITAVDTVGLLVAAGVATRFGAWADRAGAKRVLAVTMIVKGIFPALWLVVTPDHWPLAFVVVLLRAFNAAGMVCWIRLSMNLSPVRNRAAFLAMHQALMGAGAAAGAFFGGSLAETLREMGFERVMWGFRVVPLHVLFLLSAAARLSCLPLLRFIREPRRTMSEPPAEPIPSPESNGPTA